MNKLLKTIKYAYIVIFVLCMIIVALMIIQRSRNREVSIMGISSYIILSDSMKPLFSAGDLVFSQKTDVDLLEVGDVITFVSRDPLTFGENITHQIHAIGMDEGVVVFTTKGTNLDTVDQTSIFEQQINGKYWFSIPKVGYFVDFMRSNTGFIVIFILPISLLVVLEGLHFTKLYKKYVKESLMSEMSIVNGKHVDLEKLKKALEMIEEDQKNQSKIMD